MVILRTCAKSLALGCLISLFANNGWAQNYPTRPVRYIVPGSAGTGADVIARVVAAELAQVFGHQVIVDNRAGAAGSLGTAVAARAPADGYTILQISSALIGAINTYRDLPFNLARDFDPVTQLASSPQVVVVNPRLPVKSIGDFVKLAKAKPGAMNYSSAGSATSTHVAAVLFWRHAGVDLVHVPYKSGGPAIAGVITGETPIYFAPVAAVLPQIQEGTLRAVAVTTATRSPLLPDVPTIAESGYPGYTYGNWYGLLVPVTTPRATISRIHSAALEVLNRPKTSKALRNQGYIVGGGRPEEFARHIKSESERLAKLFQEIGVTAN